MTEEDRKEMHERICKLRSEHVTLKALATRFSLSITTIQTIMREGSKGQ